VYLEGLELPHFAAFVLLKDEAGRERLRRYYRPYLKLCAGTPGAGFVLETPTWRANPDWGRLLGCDAAALARANIEAARLVGDLRTEWGPRLAGPVVLSGVIGPRGDGYVVDAPSSIDDAAAYHRTQAAALRDGGVDMLAAVTMTNSAEAVGIARSAKEVGLPVAISFTVETDGRLPTGESLRDAMARVDADTTPAYFAVNCAHPTNFETSQRVVSGRHAFAESVPTRRPAATPSWTQRPSWISATPSIWATATDGCAFRCLR